MHDYQFHGNATLRDILDARRSKMQSVIGDLPAARINGATDDQLVEYFVSEYRVEPLTIYTDRAGADSQETQVDVSHVRYRRYIPHDGPVMVKGDEVTIHVPFTGDADLFKYAPSQRYLGGTSAGTVHSSGENGGTISMTLALPADTGDAEQFNKWIASKLKELTDYARWSGSDVEAFNRTLEAHARQAVEARRKQLEKRGDLLQKLAIPLRANPEAPSPTPIPMPRRVVKPLPPARKVEQEYGISHQDYEYILSILRHESRSFEATPGALAKLSEEELRDVVLGHLNTHFKGDATGERFRKRGKTDLCIEYENRAAFVAECKLWTGPKAFSGAIDQLLGYLTWRDTRTALIIWNKTNRNFVKLQADLPSRLKEHTSFVRELEPGHAGEWRAVFRSADDESRQIVIHVFLVDLSVA